MKKERRNEWILGKKKKRKWGKRGEVGGEKDNGEEWWKRRRRIEGNNWRREIKRSNRRSEKERMEDEGKEMEVMRWRDSVEIEKIWLLREKINEGWRIKKIEEGLRKRF